MSNPEEPKELSPEKPKEKERWEKPEEKEGWKRIESFRELLEDEDKDWPLSSRIKMVIGLLAEEQERFVGAALWYPENTDLLRELYGGTDGPRYGSREEFDMILKRLKKEKGPRIEAARAFRSEVKERIKRGKTAAEAVKEIKEEIKERGKREEE